MERAARRDCGWLWLCRRKRIRWGLLRALGQVRFGIGLVARSPHLHHGHSPPSGMRMRDLCGSGGASFGLGIAPASWSTRRRRRGEARDARRGGACLRYAWFSTAAQRGQGRMQWLGDSWTISARRRLLACVLTAARGSRVGGLAVLHPVIGAGMALFCALYFGEGRTSRGPRRLQLRGCRGRTVAESCRTRIHRITDNRIFAMSSLPRLAEFIHRSRTACAPGDDGAR